MNTHWVFSTVCIWKCYLHNVHFPCITVPRQQALMACVSILHLCIKYALYRICWHALSQRFHASLMMNWPTIRLADWLIFETNNQGLHWDTPHRPGYIDCRTTRLGLNCVSTHWPPWGEIIISILLCYLCINATNQVCEYFGCGVVLRRMPKNKWLCCRLIFIVGITRCESFYNSTDGLVFIGIKPSANTPVSSQSISGSVPTKCRCLSAWYLYLSVLVS